MALLIMGFRAIIVLYININNIKFGYKMTTNDY